MDALVSIIIPTYNVDKYLRRCLDSVVGQTYRNIEIIVVIDGATDSSYEIAKKYQDADNRLTVIWQENQGSGPARNNGLLHASGEYAIFVDPDDYVDLTMVEDLLDLQKDNRVDFILSDCCVFYENGKEGPSKEKITPEIIEGKDNCRKKYAYLLSSGLLGAPTKKLYRMSIIKDNNIQFPDLRRSQDIVFNYRYYDFVESILVTDKIFYHYLIDQASYALKLKADYYKTLAMIYDEIISMCERWNVGYKEKEYSQISNYFFPSVIANITANVLRKESIDELIDSPSIQALVERADDNRMDRRIFRALILCKCSVLIRILARIKALL